jgi:hypothetical protein
MFSGGDPTFLDACAQANCQNPAGGRFRPRVRGNVGQIGPQA